MQVIRAVWNPVTWDGQSSSQSYMDVVPQTPAYNEVVYVWEQSNKDALDALGYQTRLVVSDKFNENGNQFGRKLLAIEAGLQEFGEVLFLDWDCNFIKPIDQTFLDMLVEKETQIPIYIHDTPDPFDSSYEFDSTTYISSNFGFVYTRNPNLGTQLIEIAEQNNIGGCVEEWAWNLITDIANDPLGYVQNYLPRFGHGVSDTAIPLDHPNLPRQIKGWTWVEQKLNMDIYLKHE
jgi:hypothetical protein